MVRKVKHSKLNERITRLLSAVFGNTSYNCPRGGGTPHMKGVGMLVGNFELNPRKETDLGVAQAFFDP